MKRFIIIFALIGCTLASALGQSKTVAAFEAKTDGYKLFLYQSVIRMLNKDKNPEFNLLIRDLDHIKFAMTKKKAKNPKSTFTRLDRGVQGEGYEIIMSVDDKNHIVHVYEKRSRGSKSSWVATFFMKDPSKNDNGMAGVIEMKGSLNLKYLNAFASINMEKLEEMLPFKK